MAKDKKRKPHGPKVQPVLTQEQIRFCHNYFAGDLRGNAVQSYMAAGFDVATYGHAGVNAHELLKKSKILEYLKKLESDACAAAQVTTESIIRGFKNGAEADVTDMFNEQWETLPKSKWPPELRAAAASVRIKRFYDRIPDPKDKDRMIRVMTHIEIEVKTENKTENRKALAQIKKLIGTDAKATDQDAGGGVSGVNPDEL